MNLDNLAHNAQLLRKLGGEKNFFCPMVKANAYGHGDIEIALRLEAEGVEHLGVGLIEEGILLRQAGVHCKILVYGTFEMDGADAILKYQLTPVISLWEQAHALEKAAEAPVDVHVKFDTGMNRLGFRLDQVSPLLEYFSKSKILRLKGILTHLHTGEDAHDPQGSSQQQLRLFSEVEKKFSPFHPVVHALNSAALLSLSRKRSIKFGARPGLAIYGVSPFAEDFQLKPVMSLRSQIVRYHKIQAGESVSYSAAWRAQRDSLIGVVPIGYADGYHRLLSNRAQVLVAGQKVPQVGNVCMDYIMIDVTGVPHLHSDSGPEEVTLLGHDGSGQWITARELAEQAQTIPWEILTSVGERVPRVTEGLSYVHRKQAHEVHL
ncbi:MAG: alanine racemase [Proteobacteria bacterium]|nr:alanine racemase [Pseudomonadota bacterium]